MSESAVRPPLAAVAVFLKRRFYFSMSIVTTLVAVYGFHFTVDQRLLHPAIHPPLILWLHAATAAAWLALFIVQTGLVATRNVMMHMRLGLFGIVLGVVVFTVGMLTTVAMVRFHLANPGSGGNGPAFAIIPFYEIAAFGVMVAAAVALRRSNSDAHRRLMFMATCVLTSAAWGRFPEIPNGYSYAGVDFLILLGVMRDLVVMRRVHPAYLISLPLLVTLQLGAQQIYLSEPAWWMAAMNVLTA